MVQFDVAALKKWFQQEKRDLPWRQTTDPYAIWVSEVMLQQTQVAVVLPYYLRWMKQFPSIHHLANASREEVIKAWEGLGYYSRARHLHEGSQMVVKNHGGKLPYREDQLKTIKGLGPYTVGAILSFAFHQKKAAVDGNVLRVITRYFAIEEDIAKGTTQKKITQITEDLLPDEEPWIVNEALIELGATLCQRRPKCGECPLRESCKSFSLGLADTLPIKTKGPKTEKLYREVAVIECDDYILVKKGETGAIMSDLYEFPYFDCVKKRETPLRKIALQNEKGEKSGFEMQNKVEAHFGIKLTFASYLPEISHSFTRYQAYLFPVKFTSSHRPAIEGFLWVNLQELRNLPFSSGHRRILQTLLSA